MTQKSWKDVASEAIKALLVATFVIGAPQWATASKFDLDEIISIGGSLLLGGGAAAIYKRQQNKDGG